MDFFTDSKSPYPICHVCSQPIIEIDPDDVHEDHARNCNGEDGCTCDLQAHSDCCEFCQREDWPNTETWLVYRITADYAPLNNAVLREAYVLNMAGSRKPEAMRQIWERIVSEYRAAEFQQQMEAIGGNPENIDWQSLRKYWGSMADEMDQAGDLQFIMIPAVLDTTGGIIGKMFMEGDTLRFEITVPL